MRFYEKFLRLCNEKGVSPSKAGTDIGLSRSAVSRWANENAMPTDATMLKIAAYFDVPVSYFIEGGAENSGFNIQLYAAAQERVLIETFRSLDEISKAKLLVYASELAQQ